MPDPSKVLLESYEAFPPTDRGPLVAQLADVTSATAEKEVTAERERIAGDLHDVVIQRLFACSMTLELRDCSEPNRKGHRRS